MSDLAHFAHFTYANFIRHVEQVLMAVKLILNIFPNSLGIGENSSLTEATTRLTKEAGDKLHCTSSNFTVLQKITKELH